MAGERDLDCAGRIAVHACKLSQDNANVGNTSGRTASATAGWSIRPCSAGTTRAVSSRRRAFTFGNSGRNVLYGPGINNVDFAPHRFFPIPLREGMKLEFRGGTVQLVQPTEFAMPETRWVCRRPARSPPPAPNRQMQIALKLQW